VLMQNAYTRQYVRAAAATSVRSRDRLCVRYRVPHAAMTAMVPLRDVKPA
jgi:hypothetical protein